MFQNFHHFNNIPEEVAQRKKVLFESMVSESSVQWLLPLASRLWQGRKNTMAWEPGRGKSHLAHSRKQRVQMVLMPQKTMLLFPQVITLVIMLDSQNPATSQPCHHSGTKISRCEPFGRMLLLSPNYNSKPV